ncbi:MAG TPA: fimbrial protein [Lachnospiraceae bacterium]|nr:fimbrial protein [Lachnospiraceae bacterium]
MKKLRKVAGLLLALALAMVTLLGTGTAVRADDTNSLTITNKGESKHTFELYQIFTGDYDATKGVLSNVQWGSGVSSAGQTAYGTAEDEAKTLENGGANAAKTFADDLVNKSYLTLPTVSTEVKSNDSYKFDNLAAGYYLVIDKAETQADVENGAYTAYIFQVVGSVTQETKVDVPTIMKKVADSNDSLAAAVTDPAKVADWRDTADHDIGDSIPYQITGTLPSTLFSEYETYTTYTITDTLSEGLNPPEASTVKVYLETRGEGNNTVSKDITSDFTVTVKDQVLTVALAHGQDMKNIAKTAADKIVVLYNATLNSNAVIGGSGNPNTVILQYSNNPNQGGDGEKGKTPDDKNVVFTYELDVNKYRDDKNDKTNEAEFKLYKEYVDGDSKEVREITLNNKGGNDGLTYVAQGLDDGIYILQEIKAPAGYNKMDGSVTFGETTYSNAVEFKVTPTYDGGENPKVKTLGVVILHGAQAEFAGDATTGKISTDVIDQKGSSLPSTGGIGTTIFYVIGSVLVIGAGVLLVTRKRMNKKS